MTRIRHTSTLTLALLALAVPAPVLAQRTAGPYKDSRELPDTPAARRAMEVLELINANDPKQIREYISTNVHPSFRDMAPIEEHLAVFADVFASSGGYDFHAVRNYTPPRPDTEVVVILKNRLTESWEAIVASVEPDPPHLIVGLQFSPARPPSDLPPAAKITETELVSRLETFLDRMAKAEVFSGTVLLAKDGKPLFKRAYGRASKRFDVPNKIDTKFNLGSMNKMITAVAAAQLVERGKLSFDDPISKYLSTDWLPREITDKVTIEHLLTHTSGLGDFFNDKFWNSSRLLYRTVDDYKPLYADMGLAFEPGTDWSYSNAGFMLVGAVIEKVTGQSYFEYVRQHIYKPAGMVNSDSYAMDQPIPNLAIGYSKEQDAEGHAYWTNNIFKHTVSGGPAGGGFSTVEDLLKFDIAMRNHKLLSAEMTEKLWTPKPLSPDYGYGFGLHGEPGDRRVGHNGGFPGISASLEMHLDTGYTVAVLSNYDQGTPVASSKIAELLRSRTSD